MNSDQQQLKRKSSEDMQTASLSAVVDGKELSSESSSIVTRTYVKAHNEYRDADWYHGNLATDQAEKRLASCENNCFLVRESNGSLFLSTMNNEAFQHTKIEYGPGWYRLKDSSDPSQEQFEDLHKLVASTTLGDPCRKSRETNTSEFFMSLALSEGIQTLKQDIHLDCIIY